MEPKNEYETLFEQHADGDQAGWLASIDEEHWLVKTKSGIYKVRELEWEHLERARKRAGEKRDPNEIILSDSIVGKDGKDVKFGELDIRKWKGSTVMRLLAAMNYIYEVDDFLQK